MIIKDNQLLADSFNKDFEFNLQRFLKTMSNRPHLSALCIWINVIAPINIEEKNYRGTHYMRIVKKKEDSLPQLEDWTLIINENSEKRINNWVIEALGF